MQRKDLTENAFSPILDTVMSAVRHKSLNLFAPDSPVEGGTSAPGDTASRTSYGPIEGKTYSNLMRQSKPIKVEGWTFRFARPAIITSKKSGQRSWLGFTVYYESPELPGFEGAQGYKIAGVVRSMRVYKGRLYPPMVPIAPGKFMNIMQWNKTFARLLYLAIKQWPLIYLNPELGVDGVKYPLNTIGYSRVSAQHAMADYVPGTPVNHKRREKAVDGKYHIELENGTAFEVLE